VRTVRPVLRDRCPVCPVCTVGVLWPNDITLDGDPAPLAEREQRTFRSMSIVTKLSPISATAELLLTTAIWFHLRSRSIERKWSIFPIVYASAKLQEEIVLVLYMCCNVKPTIHQPLDMYTEYGTICNTAVTGTSLFSLKPYCNFLSDK